MTGKSQEVVEVAVKTRLIAGVRARVPFGQVGPNIRPNLDQVYAAGKSGAIELDGQNILVYRKHPESGLIVDFCVGANKPFAEVGAVKSLMLPEGIAAMTTCWGEYSGIRAATDVVQQWIRANNRVHEGTSWEIYGHWNEDPSKLRTDIYYLLKP